MSDFLTRLIQPILKIHKSEWPKALLMFGYFFLIIGTYYIIKPVRSAIFLDRLGPDKLPYVYMGEAALVGIVSWFYVRFVDRHRKETILIASTAIFSACLLVFWFLFRFQVPWFAFLFYLWASVFSTMSVTQFWLLSNDLFNPREAKRLFGFIGSGGVLGAIYGGFLTAKTAHDIGTENLLLLSAGIILLCVVFIKLVFRYEPAEIKEESAPAAREEIAAKPAPSKSTLGLISGSTYLILLLLIVGLGRILSTFVDFQFQSAVNEAFFSKDSKTAFFGGFFAALNGAAFVVQLLVTSRVLKKFGVGAALLVLPAGLLLGLGGFMLFPILWLASFNKFFDGSLNYSLQSASREILYLPIDRTVRHKVKPFIDMFIYRFSKGLGGFLILILMSLLGLSTRGISVIALLFIGVWFLVAVLMKREYITALKDMVSGSAKSHGDALRSTNGLQPKFLEALGNEELKNIFQEFADKDDRTYQRIVELAQLALYEAQGDGSVPEDPAADFIKALYRQEHLKTSLVPGDEVAQEAELDGMIMEILKRDIPASEGSGEPEPVSDGWISKLKECVEKRTVSDGIRRKAIEALRILGGRESEEVLTRALQDPEETLRYDLIKALGRLRQNQQKPILDRIPLTRYVGQEVERYSQVLFIIQTYQKRLRSAAGDLGSRGESFLKILENLREESFERIFCLLALHYPSEVIMLIYDRYREGDSYVRAHAAELLDNIVGHEIERILLPVLEQDPAGPAVMERGRSPLGMEEAGLTTVLRGRDSWLAVMTVFLVMHFKIGALVPSLEALSEEAQPSLQKAAARLALSLDANSAKGSVK